MGSCCSSQQSYLEDLEYKQHAELHIIERDRSGNDIGRTSVSFGLSGPIEQMKGLADVRKVKIRAVGCILPGLDPRGECEKECQDSFSFISKVDTFLSVLFDGHGKDGRRVSLFCKDYMINYFEKFYENFEQDPQAAIEEMVDMCDNELFNSGIECNLSGTAAVIIVINSLGIHAGSVGDSRAVLATLPKDNSVTIPVYKNMPYKRVVRPLRNLNAVALTIDQKPNHEGELKRILSAGGIVEKLANDLGKAVGPYRV